MSSFMILIALNFGCDLCVSLQNTDLRLQLLASNGMVGQCPKRHIELEEENETLRQKNRKLTEALNNAINESTNLMERALLVSILSTN